MAKHPFPHFVKAIKGAKVVYAEIEGSHGGSLPVSKKEAVKFLAQYPEGFRCEVRELQWNIGKVVFFTLREIRRGEDEE